MARLATLKSWCVALALAALAGRAAQGQNVTLVINPRTGQSKIQNVGAAAVNLDAYLIGSEGALNPAGWTSLQDAGALGWREGSPNVRHLSEGNLTSSTSLASGGALSLGAAYTPFAPTEIGQPEPAVMFDYHVAGGATMRGNVLFAPANNLVLVVDAATGAVSIQNQSNFNVSIDAYMISSPTGVLASSTWTSFADNGATSWREGAPGVRHLSETNLTGSRMFAANGSPVSLGSPINPALLTSPSDLAFDYHVAGGATIRGYVAFALPATAPGPLDGDFDTDADVDGTDFLVWQRGFGSAYSGVDFGKWKAGFGTVGGGATPGAHAAVAPVPEPQGWALGLGGMLAAALGQRLLRRRPAVEAFTR